MGRVASLKMTINSRRPRGAWSMGLGVFLLAGLAVLLQLPWSPPNHKIHVDGTVFAYGGARILQGDLPYRDFWDHKPPGIFYLNALAFGILGVDAWSLWYLSLVWTLAIAGFFYFFLLRLTSRRYALLMTAVLLASVLQPRFYQGANLTEFYGLLPATLALLITHAHLTRPRGLNLVGLGIVLTASALLKHTNIGTPLACVAVVSYGELREWGSRRALRHLVAIAMPALLTSVLVATYWASHGAFEDLWQATVEYNVLYSNGGWGIRSAYGTLRDMAADPSLSPMLVLGLGAGLVQWSPRKRWQSHHPPDGAGITHNRPTEVWLLAACLAALALEVLFISLASRGFGHYYMTVLPALVASASYWFWRTPPGRPLTNGERIDVPVARALVASGLLVWLVVVFGLVRPSGDDVRSFVLDAPTRRPLRTDLGKIVAEQTDPSDTVLVWGTGAEINFETGRRSPSRYIYYQPLFQPGFHNEERWGEFLDDLATERPAMLIVPWQGGSAPTFDAPLTELAARCGCAGEVLEGLTAFASYVEANYRRELILEETFAVYRPIVPQGASPSSLHLTFR